MSSVIDDLEPRTLAVHEFLPLDILWNEAGGFVPSEIGRYRVYASFNDENGLPIQTVNGGLEARYEFMVE